MRTKLILTYLIIILLMAALFLAPITGMIRGMVAENIRQVSEQIVTQAGNELGSVLEFGKSYLLDLAIDREVQALLRDMCHQAKDTSVVMDDSHKGMLSIERSTQILGGNSIVMRNIPFWIEVCYVDENSAVVPFYVSPRQNVSPDKRYTFTKELADQLFAADGKFLWSVSSDETNNYIKLSKVVYDTQAWNTPIGVLSLEFNYQYLALSVLRNLRNQNGIDAYIVDKTSGTAVGYSGNPTTLHIPLSLSGNVERLSDDGSDYIIERSLAASGFYLVGIQTMAQVESLGAAASKTLLMTIGIAIFLAIGMATFFAHRITRPVRTLSNIMKNVENGDLDIYVEAKEKNEIGELYSSFNYMIQMINQLIEDNYVWRLNQKQSEINALEAQINTHFLYNTLDSINWLATAYDADDISNLVLNLSSFLRLSLNNGSPTLTVRQELEHVKSYITIQNIRFDDLFSIRWEIDEKALSVSMLKMLLQPLVENAIHHAFNMPGRDKRENLLVIAMRLEGDALIIRVKSNGDIQALNKINAQLAKPLTDEYSSYGLLSIRTRLEVFYSGRARYSYYLEDDHLLTAQIELPATIDTNREEPHA